MPQNFITLRVTARELHTILAALRYYQQQGHGVLVNQPSWVADIASNLGEVTPLSGPEIDRLCLRLNHPEEEI